MTLEKHDLLHELPEHKDIIHELKLNDNHFAKLFAEYHETDHEIHRIEQGVETPSDDYTEQRKKQRLLLKDQLLHMIKKHEAQVA
jgi:hypothetical protein